MYGRFMDTVGGSKNCPFKTKYTDLTFTPTATGRKTKTARAYHAWWPRWVRTVCAYKLQHKRHQHWNSLLKSKEHQLELVCNLWHETWDERVSSRLHTNSSVSKGIASRVELGKIRHLDTGLLWMQHHVSRRNVETRKLQVPRTEQTLERKT